MVDPEELLLRRERLRVLLDEARAAVSPVQWKLLIALYGLEGEEPRLVPVLAAEYGVTRERIRQRRDSALARARKPVRQAARLL